MSLRPLILCLLAASAFAQDWSAGPSRARKLTVLDSCAVLTGDVLLRYSTLELEAEAVAVWAQPDSLRAALSAWDPGGDTAAAATRRRGMLRERLTLELYAEGNVQLRWGGNSVDAARLFLDFRTGRATAESVRVRIRNPAEPFPGVEARLDVADLRTFQFRTPRVELAFEGLRDLDRIRAAVEEGRPDLRLIEARGDSLVATTCLHEEPHYAVFVARGTIRPVPDLPEVYTLEGEGFEPQLSLPLTGAATAEFGVPGLRWVPLWWRTDLPWPYSISVGESREFGTSVEQTVRWTFPGRLKLKAEADWYSRRGWGYGFGLKQRQPGHLFELSSYYIRDKGDDGTGFVPDDEERWRIKTRDVLELPFGLRQELQIHAISDRGFREEYFEREVNEDKEPESLLQYRWARESYGVALLGRLRLNRFQTQTERRPALRGVLAPKHLFDVPGLDAGVYLSADAELAELWRSFDEDLDLPSYRAERGDLRLGLDAPFPVGYFVFRPQVGVRGTAWSGPDVEAQRLAFEAGGEIGTFLARDFDASWELLDIAGLRHSIYPVVGYLHRFDVSRRPETLLFFDETDSLDRLERFRFKLRQRLQARGTPRRRLVLQVAQPGRAEELLAAREDVLELRRDGASLTVTLPLDTRTERLLAALEEEGVLVLSVAEEELVAPVRDIVEWQLEQDYFPDSHRDNPGKPWGALRSELRLPLMDRLSAYLRSRHDPHGDLWLSSNVGVDYWWEEVLRVTVDHGYVSDRAAASNVFLSFTLSDRWQGMVSGRYNWNDERLDEHTYTLRRIFDRFHVDFELGFDRGDDDVSFNLEVGLIDLLQDDDSFRLASGERPLDFREER